jgi:hypothetical protein
LRSSEVLFSDRGAKVDEGRTQGSSHVSTRVITLSVDQSGSCSVGRNTGVFPSSLSFARSRKITKAALALFKMVQENEEEAWFKMQLVR